MQFALVFSALVAAVIATPVAQIAVPGADQQCKWTVGEKSETISAGSSITLNGVDVACGTTSQINFGVGAKCKLQPGQAGSFDQVADVAPVLGCVYKGTVPTCSS